MIKKISAKQLYDICKKQGLITDKDNITYKEFYYITRDFNKEISDAIVEGYKFTTDKFGTFQIVKKERYKKMIDWGTSNKMKARLIEEGKVPFDKNLHPEGVNWLAYFTSPVSYTWIWLRNVDFWSFMPSWHNKVKLGVTVKKKIETNTEDYVPYLQNNIKSAYNL